LDNGHIEGFVEVLFQRVSHWRKGKGTIEDGFDNMRLERRPSLVNLRRLEPPRGKRLGRGRVLVGWSRHMSFKKISSRKVERECPLGGVTGKDKGLRLRDNLPKCR
jgi:hypothetical protein